MSYTPELSVCVQDACWGSMKHGGKYGHMAQQCSNPSSNLSSESLCITGSNDMPMFTAPALLIGLGARILLNKFSRGIDAEPSLPESILLGVWQGVAAQYASKHGILAILPGTAIPAKLFYDWHTSTDPNQRFLTTIIGLLLGVVSAELLSSYLDVPPEAHDPDDEDASEVSSLPRKRTRSLPSRYLPPVPQHHTPKPAGERTVKFRPSVQGGDTESSVRPALTLVSDIPSLSVGSTFDMLLDAPAAASPVEREIAALRARASLADSERRRYKEERKWALSQGDDARAEQMKSEYKRYKTLMESCHREADQRLLAMEGAYASLFNRTSNTEGD